jgi:phosphatidylinositol-3-phosphatase
VIRARHHLVALIGLAAATLGLASTARAATPPPIHHVFIIVLENESESSTFGPNPPAPYLAKTLTSQGAFVPGYYGTGHESNDNYISMISGQAPNPQNQADCQIFNDFTPDLIGADGQAVGNGCVFPSDVKTIADQLDAKGLTWRDYNQSMGADPTREPGECGHPGVGQQDHTQSATATDQYATRHNPFVYFHSIIDDTVLCDSHVVNLSLLAQDLANTASTPNYVFITPDLCADGHDATCADPKRPGGYAGIDDFLKTWVPRITSSPAFRQDNGLLLINFDEASTSDTSSCCGEIAGPNSPSPGIGGPGGGKTGAVLLSPCIRPGTVSSVSYNHYTMLRSVEDIFGLSHLGYAGLTGGQSFGSDIFTKPGCAGGAPGTVLHLRAPALASAVSAGPHVPIRWRATGPPAASFTLQVRQTSGVGRHPWRTLFRHTRRHSMTLSGRFGATYQIRARANGGSGAVSRWATATTVMPSRIPRGQYRGRWTTATTPGAWGGKAITGRSPGASYSVQFVGGSLSVVGETSPRGGLAQIMLDGKARTIRLHAARTQARRVLFASRLAAGRHRLQIRVIRGLVPLEGLAIANRRS